MFATTDTLVEMFPHTDGILDMFPHTADIHNGVSGHIEVVSLLQKMSNTRLKEITLDVDMEEYHRIMNRTEVTADATE